MVLHMIAKAMKTCTGMLRVAGCMAEGSNRVMPW
jgi:hypothetical protein